MIPNIPQTPSRNDRLQFPHSTPSHHHPSPGPTRTTTSSTSSTPPHMQQSTSNSSNAKPTAAPITLAALLEQHASAPNPHMAALDQALAERNALSSQNSQLWKLIEKQRSGYNQMLKELERVRAERDSLRGRVGSGGSRERSVKPSTSNSAMASSNGDARPVPTRHVSDDVLTTPRSEQNDLSSSQSRSNHSHRPAPPSLQVPSRADSLPSGTPSSAVSSVAYSPETPLPSSTPSLVINPSSPPSQPSGGYPPRQSSIPTIPSTNTPQHSNQSSTANSSAYSSSISLNATEAPPPPSTFVSPPLSPPQTAPSLPPQTAGYSPMMQAALAPPQMAATMLSPVVEAPNKVAAAMARDSRISLPDEAKRYIATMGESPNPSPKMVGFQGQGQGQSGLASDSPSTQSEPNNENPSTPQSHSQTPSSETGETEFLDMDEADGDDEDEEDEDDEDEVETNLPRPAPQPQVQITPLPPTQPLSVSPPKTNGRGPKAGVEDFPLPPSLIPAAGHAQPSAQQQQQPAPLQPQAPHPQQVYAQIQAQAQAQVQAQGFSLTKQQAQGFAQAHARATQAFEQQQQQQAFEQPQPPQAQSPPQRPREPETYPQIHAGSETHSSPYLSSPNNLNAQASSTSLMTSTQSLSSSLGGSGTTTTSPAFRALPLISTDLPTTRINVTNSTIRPNDRGKEVLNFFIQVDPGHGKDPWQVEKLYSDVLGLDARIRASVGKGVGKKIASLPEGKLWRDHAPAKVDQRKVALETYLQNLINLPVKNKDEIIAFFCSDIVRDTKKPVHQVGYKEGYLTKRGKNFGGWKTRYFVLQGPVLEYYESRGGTHLGSITITGAQIGRQQRAGDRRENDEEKEYRHAFLIIEAKKGPSGSSARHVLCAESDRDRDDWVEVLVRYVMGTYNEESAIGYGPGPPPLNTTSTTSSSGSQPRSSTSSNAPFSDNLSTPTRRPINRGMSKDDIIARGPAVPLSQLPQDAANAKLFQAPAYDDLRAPSPSKSMDPSPTDRFGSGGFSDSDHARRIIDRGQQNAEPPASSSLPSSSPLDAVSGAGGQRSNSEMGHYPDLQDQRGISPERQRPRDQYRERKSFHPTLNTVAASNPSTPARPEQDPAPAEFARPKISGPVGGTVIPAGMKFGGKDAPPEPAPSAQDRREKAKSRSFWGFGKGNASEKHPTVTYAARAVFGVTLEESLDVVQIANLPAVIFRCIQYLEAKKADQEEGIYRLSGSSAVIKSLKDRFNAEGDVDLLASDEYWDPHAIAGLLKSYLRELPASILTRELHLRFLSVIDFVDPQERIQELSHLIASLPIANYSLLRALTAHLILIVQNATVNKMTMRNVGIVFSPTLGIPAGVFSLMLGEFNRVFNVDAGGIDEQDEPSAVEDISRRNSRQYSDAAADELLGLSGRSLKPIAAPVVEEPQSETDSIDYESADSTDEGGLVESSSVSSPGGDDSPQTPKASKTNHASGVAASRGLNIQTSNRGNRHSRMMGLPGSPRPPLSPNYGQQPDTVPSVPSPMHTPK